ncbi:alpha/beta hydrolase [Xylophilus sp.]|uniref:alpha/beta hydrolase n=1 Tax=Xylophilus sp. TaxID=2653893 RepID=UPI002D808067|nr:alpha/beta fold hydrolase [Xylophilus sp.]
MTANEFFLEGEGEAGRTGVLLVHGLTGTPNEMRTLGRGLHRAGFTVYAVELAGHCGTEDDLVATRWQDWYASVEAGALRLAARVDRVLVAGLSMGALLALRLAARQPERIAGVAALAPIFRHDGWSMPAYTRLSFLLRAFKALRIGRRGCFTEQPPYGIKDEALRARIVAQMNSGDSTAAGLPGNPWWAVAEMHKLAADVLHHELRRIQQPCLVIHAAEDDVAKLSNAQDIVRRVPQAELVVLHDSYHLIVIDRERRTVIARTADFVGRVAGIAPRRAAPAAAQSVQRALAHSA